MEDTTAKRPASLDIEEIAQRNPKVDLELLRRAQEEMNRLDLKVATYNLQGAFTRRTSFQ